MKARKNIYGILVMWQPFTILPDNNELDHDKIECCSPCGKDLDNVGILIITSVPGCEFADGTLFCFECTSTVDKVLKSFSFSRNSFERVKQRCHSQISYTICRRIR